MKFHHHRAAAALFAAASVASSLAQAAAVSGQGTWETTLQGRDLDGNAATFEAYYDTALNLTWLANANYALTTKTWSVANTWATNLNPYGSGISGWRLPTTIDVGNDGATYSNVFQGVDYGYNITTHSEMSHLFYVTLGNKAYYDTSGTGPQAGWGLTNTGPFSNLESSYYWSTTEYAPNTSLVWLFGFGNGGQGADLKTINAYAWAVHPGDVGAVTVSTVPVPVPAAAWLLGSGLVGLIGFARRRPRQV